MAFSCASSFAFWLLSMEGSLLEVVGSQRATWMKCWPIWMRREKDFNTGEYWMYFGWREKTKFSSGPGTPLPLGFPDHRKWKKCRRVVRGTKKRPSLLVRESHCRYCCCCSLPRPPLLLQPFAFPLQKARAPWRDPAPQRKPCNKFLFLKSTCARKNNYFLYRNECR